MGHTSDTAGRRPSSANTTGRRPHTSGRGPSGLAGGRGAARARCGTNGSGREEGGIVPAWWRVTWTVDHWSRGASWLTGETGERRCGREGRGELKLLFKLSGFVLRVSVCVCMCVCESVCEKERENKGVYYELTKSACLCNKYNVM